MWVMLSLASSLSLALSVVLARLVLHLSPSDSPVYKGQSNNSKPPRVSMPSGLPFCPVRHGTILSVPDPDHTESHKLVIVVHNHHSGSDLRKNFAADALAFISFYSISVMKTLKFSFLNLLRLLPRPYFGVNRFS